jgi:hypothetical protein
MLLVPLIVRVATFISAISCVHAFSLGTSSAVNVRAIHQPGCRTTHQCVLSKPVGSRIVLKAAESEEDDGDDGWGDSVSTTTATSSSERISKSQELANLQNDMAMKQQKQSSASTGRVEGEERDLFIPIVTLVSVIGFSGLYGYEMLRLYSRGELYLPWN